MCSEFACPANQHPRKKAHIYIPLRTSWISTKMCPPCLIIIQSCYFDYTINKPFTCSRCVICVSCSRSAMRAKDHRLFSPNYPQNFGESGYKISRASASGIVWETRQSNMAAKFPLKSAFGRRRCSWSKAPSRECTAEYSYWATTRSHSVAGWPQTPITASPGGPNRIVA